nr:hypothetical protein [uncultured Rhodopila sp.]
MLVSLGLSREALCEALDAAEPAVALSTQLHAPVRGALAGKVESVWRLFRKAILDAGAKSADLMQQAHTEAIGAFDAVIAEAGDQAERIAADLQDRLGRLLGSLFDHVLAQVRPQLTVGGQEMTLNGLKIATEHKIGANVRASLSQILALVSEGTFKLEATYTLSPS